MIASKLSPTVFFAKEVDWKFHIFFTKIIMQGHQVKLDFALKMSQSETEIKIQSTNFYEIKIQ
jgi:hypothetical protein